MFGRTYRCDHPLYKISAKCTLYQIGNKEMLIAFGVALAATWVIWKPEEENA